MFSFSVNKRVTHWYGLSTVLRRISERETNLYVSFLRIRCADYDIWIASRYLSECGVCSGLRACVSQLSDLTQLNIIIINPQPLQKIILFQSKPSEYSSFLKKIFSIQLHLILSLYSQTKWHYIETPTEYSPIKYFFLSLYSLSFGLHNKSNIITGFVLLFTNPNVSKRMFVQYG